MQTDLLDAPPGEVPPSHRNLIEPHGTFRSVSGMRQEGTFTGTRG
jgi:hypothetical protein